MKKVLKIICASIAVIMCLQISTNYILAASKTKTVNFGYYTLTATEKITVNVTLKTLNNPTVTYSQKSGTSGMVNNVWNTYTGINNNITKKISSDTATYTITSKAHWIDSNKQTHYSGTQTTTFKYEGTLS